MAKRKPTGRARKVQAAPTHCKQALSQCMRGPGGRSKAGRCMRAFNQCIR